MKTQYQHAKEALRNISIEAKEHFKNDKPAIRMHINNAVNWVSDDFNLTDHKNSLLHDYACTLHP